MKRNKQSAARAARRKQRRRGGVQSIILAPNDSAVVFRARGSVRFYNSRSEPNPGTGAFWNHLLRWLFADNEDAAERRQILQDDFFVDVQAHMMAQRQKAIKETAKNRVMAEIAGMDDEPEMTDERVEDLMAELLPKHVAAIEAELEVEAEEQRAKVQTEAEARAAEAGVEITEAGKLEVGPNGECPICGKPHDLEAGCPGTPEGDGGPI